MDRKETMQRWHAYLNKNKIYYVDYLTDQKHSLTMRFEGFDNAPNQVIECSIRVFEGYSIADCFFDEIASQWVRNHPSAMPQLLLLINHLNEFCFPMPNGGLHGSVFFVPRFYVSENGDIAVTALFDTNTIGLRDIQETVTRILPSMMNGLSKAFFAVVLRAKVAQELYATVDDLCFEISD